ncbi:MAG: 3-oxoacyl-ACP synthase III family protein [Bradymonadaceae bacterium]
MTSVITGTGHHLPSRKITNEELAPQLNSSAEWIEERSGIRQRYFIAPGETNRGLGEQAARKALADADLQPTDIDAIIFATLSPDVAFPGSGVFLQEALGLEGIPALDVRAQCSGFLYALSVAHGWLSSGMYRRILVVGSEVHSTGLDLTPEGRGVSVLFGDGAGAAVLEARREEEAGILDIRLGADGRGAHLLTCERPGSQFHPSISAADIEAGRHYPTMEGRAVFRRAVELLERELHALFERHAIDPVTEDVLLIPHQSNRRINEMVASRLGLRDEQVVHTIELFGNTTAASIPMALDIARKDERARPGRLVALGAFGSGLTWGTALIRF